MSQMCIRGRSIHRTDCVNMLHLTEAERARLIDAEWEGDVAEKAGGQYLAEIKIYAYDRQGFLMEMSKIFTEMEAVSYTHLDVYKRQAECKQCD